MNFDLATEEIFRQLPAFATRGEIAELIRVGLEDAHEAGRIEGRLDVLTGQYGGHDEVAS